MTPKELIGTQVQAKGGKGGRMDAVHSGGSRHTAWGVETSDRGWRVACGDKFQVYNDPLWEEMWGAGDRYQLSSVEGY